MEAYGVAVGYITEGIVQGWRRRSRESQIVWLKCGLSVEVFGAHRCYFNLFQRFPWSFSPLVLYFKGSISSNFSNGCD